MATLNGQVAEVRVEHGRAVGVVTERARRWRRAPWSPSLNSKLLFGRLVDPAELAADFRERIARYRCSSGTFRMNVARSESPGFTWPPEPGDHLTGGVIIAPSLAYMERAYADARAHGWSKEPIVPGTTIARRWRT